MSLDNADLALSAVLLVQGGAPINRYAFVNQFTIVTNANNACTLPASPVLGKEYTIRNSGVAVLQIFPQVGGTIDTLAANAAYSLSPGNSVKLLCTGALTWLSLVLTSPGPDTATNLAMTAMAAGVQPTGASIIPAGQFFSKVATVANGTANLPDGVGLPAAPFLNQPYVVANGSVNICSVWPDATVGSFINNFAANTPAFLGGGASACFVPVANVGGVITWLMYGYVGPEAIFPITATPLVLGVNHVTCCKAFLVNVATGTYTLPATASMKGVRVSFINGATGAGTQQIINANALTPFFGNTIVGPRAANNPAITVGVGTLSVRFGATCLQGDRIDIIGDGTSLNAIGWSGSNVAATSILFT